MTDNKLYREQYIKVLGMIARHAENQDQLDMFQKHSYMVWKELEPEYVLRNAVGTFYDGLAYGNWPWTHIK